jgi:hypothetical protein
MRASRNPSATPEAGRLDTLKPRIIPPKPSLYGFLDFLGVVNLDRDCEIEVQEQ